MIFLTRIVFAIVLLSPSLSLAQRTTGLDSNIIVFTHVTVIDATGAPARPGMSVVITGHRITAIYKVKIIGGAFAPC